MADFFGTIIVLATISGIVFITKYNALQQQANNVKRRRADIMAAMKKRFDLIGRLMDVAKSYGAHEEAIQISSSANMANINDAMAMQRKTDIALSQISSLAMSFPDLKANTTYQQLMNQLHGIEDGLQEKRESYNAAVSAYNTYRASIPQSLFAASMGFEEAPYYNVDEAGVEIIPEFGADDGRVLRSGISHLASGAKRAAHQTGQRVTEAVADARSRVASSDTAADDRRIVGSANDDTK